MSNHELILLRHGESEWNAKNLFTGWVDVRLSQAGEAEAARGGKLLAERNLLPDVVHTSLLRRAIHSSQLALDACDRHWIPVHRSWRLNERHYGALQGKDKKETLAKYGEEQFKLWRRSYESIIPDLKAGKRVLVTAHGNSLRALVMHLDGISEADIAELNIPTGIPLLYNLDSNFAPIKKGGEYLDPETAKAAIQAVANQGKR